MLGVGERFDYSENWQFVRLYGSPSAVQRKTLLDGGKLVAQNLSSFQQNILARLIYGGESQIEFDPAEMEKAMESGQADFTTLYASLKREPTELLPNGIDPACTVTMTLSADDVLFVTTRYKDYEQPPQAMDMESIAWMLFAPQRKDLFPWAADQSITGFRLGSRQQYSFAIGLPQSAVINGSVEDASRSPGPVLTFDQLPADTKKKLQEKLDEQAKGYEGVKPGQLGTPLPKNRIPPPSR